MEAQKTPSENKGGRPRKPFKKDQLLALKCSLYERKVIEAKAKSVQLSVSEYLRAMALNGKIDRRHRALPKEVLQLTGTLNHMAANMNQIAKKLNSSQELTIMELIFLKAEARELTYLSSEIKNYLR